MLATFGLERLEAGITDNSADSAGSADYIAKFIEAAAPRPALGKRVPVRRPDPDFLTVPPLRTALGAGRRLDDEPGLPTRRYGRAEANPQFQAAPHANRV
jgi:hypothetical protein